MLIKFTTRFGQLLMQGEPALALLRLAGHSGTVPSAVLEADLPAFLARLRSGLELHGEEYSPAPAPAATANDAESDQEDPRERPIKLRLRAVPFVEMIETAIRQHADLMWERA
jgi:Domain of unknown function (DUF1840)